MYINFDLKENKYKNIILNAKKFSNFRQRCKEFLKNNGINHDKFTVVEHDSELGYISEQIVLNYLKNNLDLSKFNINHWKEQFNFSKIENILKKVKPTTEEINVIREYFYDKYDIAINNKNKTFYLDVKTAETTYTPNKNWNFLYPVIQANKSDDYFVVLTYIIKNDIDKVYTKAYIMGAIDYREIKNSKIQKKGTCTRFDTESQINNYITELKNYKDLLSYTKNKIDVK